MKYFFLLICSVLFLGKSFASSVVFDGSEIEECTDIQFTDSEKLGLIKVGNKLRQYLIDSKMTKNHILENTLNRLIKNSNSQKKLCKLEILSKSLYFPVRFGIYEKKNDVSTLSVDFLSQELTLVKEYNNFPLENISDVLRTFSINDNVLSELQHDCNESKENKSAWGCFQEWTNENKSPLYLITFENGKIVTATFIYQE